MSQNLPSAAVVIGAERLRNDVVHLDMSQEGLDVKKNMLIAEIHSAKFVG